MKRQEKETVADTEDVKSASIFLKAVNSIKENRVSVVSFDECKFNDSMVDDFRITSYNVCYTKLLRVLTFLKSELKKLNWAKKSDLDEIIFRFYKRSQIKNIREVKKIINKMQSISRNNFV